VRELRAREELQDIELQLQWVHTSASLNEEGRGSSGRWRSTPCKPHSVFWGGGAGRCRRLGLGLGLGLGLNGRQPAQQSNLTLLTSEFLTSKCHERWPRGFKIPADRPLLPRGWDCEAWNATYHSTQPPAIIFVGSHHMSPRFFLTHRGAKWLPSASDRGPRLFLSDGFDRDGLPNLPHSQIGGEPHSNFSFTVP